MDRASCSNPLSQPQSAVDSSTQLAGFSEADRAVAHTRYQILRPFLEFQIPLSEIARRENIPISTAWRWVKRYRSCGLVGLCRKTRSDRNRRRLAPKLQEAIEGLALQKPRLSSAAIHRKVTAIAEKLGERVPSYASVYQAIRQVEPALMTMAHAGTKVYSDTFDLLQRTEASAPNAIWQADHTELDILVLDENREARKPWLTVILDDYSRAVAGYFLSFASPSAMQTALTLRQAIWRKAQPGWHVCGIPEMLYTDHGSDFTSRHIEQVVADLKIRLVFSGIGRPRGRGKVERFFATVTQVFLQRTPGYAPGAVRATASLTLHRLAAEFEGFLLREYHMARHASTGEPPQARWEAGGFLPQMPASLEDLDLLLMTVAKARRVQQDGIHFMGLRYISTTLAAYVGETVVVRYDPRDMAEVRVFHQDRFLCRAICQELAGDTVSLREIVRARDHRRHALRQTLQERRRTVEALLDARRGGTAPDDEPVLSEPVPPASPPALKRYQNE